MKEILRPHVKSWLLVSTTINPTQPTNYVMFNFENMFIAYVFFFYL